MFVSNLIVGLYQQIMNNMFHTFPDKIVTTRKKHSCWGCYNLIPIGNTILKTSGVWPGESHFNGYYCEKCASYLKTQLDWSEYEGGLFQGDIAEHADYKDHIVTPLNELKLYI